MAAPERLVTSLLSTDLPKVHLLAYPPDCRGTEFQADVHRCDAPIPAPVGRLLLPTRVAPPTSHCPTAPSSAAPVPPRLVSTLDLLKSEAEPFALVHDFRVVKYSTLVRRLELNPSTQSALHEPALHQTNRLTLVLVPWNRT